VINPLNHEPVVIVNAVRYVAVAAMLSGKLKLTMPELIAWLTALEAVLTLFTRSQVTSGATLEAMQPKDLAKAQATSEPVKAIVEKLP
jgi:hypothetical protein